MSSPKTVTRLLTRWNDGDRTALDELLPIVYAELRRLARSYLRDERADHTLQPTALVHEAYLRLVDSCGATWQNRAHFFGCAARLMRQILVDHARHRHAAKRGGECYKLPLDDALDFYRARDVNLIHLDDALKRLATIDAQAGGIVELRFFGGLSVEEAATVLDISPATANRDWRYTKAWLRREIAPE